MIKLILTCEHGGNDIPAEYKSLFKNAKKLLETHRGYDIGVLEIFNNLKSLSDFYSFSETSRLLIELNRSLNHKNLFSDITKQLDPNTKSVIIKKYYLPYRTKVENKINEYIKKDYKVVHISVHTFTPVLNNEVRNCDIGLLYNPKHKLEKNFCKTFKQNIKSINHSLNIRFNYPYLGTADGFTSYLRKRFPAKDYSGIELEVNQKFVLNDKKALEKLNKNIKDALSITIIGFQKSL